MRQAAEAAAIPVQGSLVVLLDKVDPPNPFYDREIRKFRMEAEQLKKQLEEARLQLQLECRQKRVDLPPHR